MKTAGTHLRSWILMLLAGSCMLFFSTFSVSRAESAVKTKDRAQQTSLQAPPVLAGQAQEEVDAKSAGCLTCHSTTDSASMHPGDTVHLGCTDCHGGKADVTLPPGTAKGSSAYEELKKKAHVAPRWAIDAYSSANPVRAYTKWLQESTEYIQFVNPGDLRVADRTCGTAGCHMPEVRRVRTSMMTHGAMLWAAALYNNGSFPLKNAHFGQSHSTDGIPQKLQTWPPPTDEETRKK